MIEIGKKYKYVGHRNMDIIGPGEMPAAIGLNVVITIRNGKYWSGMFIEGPYVNQHRSFLSEALIPLNRVKNKPNVGCA